MAPFSSRSRLNTPTERICAQSAHIQGLNDEGIRRTTFFDLVTQSLARTEGEPCPIRRAKALAHLLNESELVVFPHEIVAGSIVGTWPLAQGLPSYEEQREEAVAMLSDYVARKNSQELSPRFTRRCRFGLTNRDRLYPNINFTDQQRLIEDMLVHFHDQGLTRSEVGREIFYHFNFDYGPKVQRLMNELPWFEANHLDLNYGKVVRRGFGGILEEINDRLTAVQDPDKITFYESTKIAIEAAIHFIRRYADELEINAAARSTNQRRAAELNEMAGICRKVASGKPDTFREGLQLVWLTHVIGNIQQARALSFARFDQYLWPLYRDGLADGTITPDEARELIGCIWLKVNEPHMRAVQSVALAGTTREGTDAANELTLVCLQACADVKMPYPNVAVRVSKNSPKWLFNQVIETIKLGFGQPMFFNDDVWIPNLHRVGFPISDARDYYNMGCVEAMVMGRQPEGANVHIPDWDWTQARERARELEVSPISSHYMVFPQIVELVFSRGRENTAGQTGLDTGALESFKTFEQFLDAYCRQISERIRFASVAAWRNDLAAADVNCDPFASAMLEGPLENGRDMFQGGCALPPIRRIDGFGLGTAVDSLAAIKKYVYDEKLLTLQELKESLDNDYEDREDLRLMLEGGTPCYGNDIEDTDSIARRVFNTYADAVHALNDGSVPGPFVTSVFSYTHHVNIGEVTGATPNGRHARAPFSETIGPSQGMDKNGPTALLRSAAKLDHSRITGACALNVKLTPSLLRGDYGHKALKSLIKTYLSLGGPQIQVNVVGRETLLDAQIHPERNRNLVVRVAGFCSNFTMLDRALQDEIISRTSHDL